MTDLATAPAALDVPRVPWDAFVAQSFRWEQGEHVGICGPTGFGKTTLMLALAPMRRYSCIVATKPKDRTLASLKRKGWRTIANWRDWRPGERRVILWPKQVELTRTDRIRAVIVDALGLIYRAGSWAVFLDDLQALCDTIGIKLEVRHLLLNGRSVGITVVGSTQRPRWVPKELWTQATHLFLGRCVDADDLRHISGIGHADPKLVRQIVASLDGHDFLYVNTRTGQLVISRAPAPGRG